MKRDYIWNHSTRLSLVYEYVLIFKLYLASG